MHDDGDTVVCSECVSDEFLRQRMADEASTAECSYCHGEAIAISLAQLSELVHEVMERDFRLTASEPLGYEYAMHTEFGGWERAGEPVGIMIEELIGGDRKVAEDVRDHLSGLFGYTAVRDGEEDPYDENAQYEEREPDDLDFRDTWESFCAEVRFRARFFGHNSAVDLDNIFGPLSEHANWSGEGVVREIDTSAEDRFIYRGRLALTQDALKRILMDPVSMLAAPPSRSARSGRMNPAGISVFYGAKDSETCVAELRTPVGSHVVVGRFEVIRSVRLLDFRALTEIYVPGSHFDPEFPMRCGRAGFLRKFVAETSRPVMPGEEELEYLPTQVVAEYLSSRIDPPIDGVLFPSTQRNGDGDNVVLFNHASLAAPSDRPEGTEMSCILTCGDKDDGTPCVAVFEDVPPEVDKHAVRVEAGSPTAAMPVASVADEHAASVWLPQREPTLRLDVESLKVLTVQGISPSCQQWLVDRIRSVQGERCPF